MESTEDDAREVSPADSTTAASGIPANAHGGHKRRHRRSSKKHERTLGDPSPTYESSSESGGTPSPHSRMRSQRASAASSGLRSGASPVQSSSLQARDAASAAASAPAPEGPSEPAPASAPEKRPYELPEPGAAEYPASSYSSPRTRALEIAAVPAMWSPTIKVDEEKNQAKVVLPIIVAALIVGLLGAFIFSMMISGRSVARRSVRGHNTDGDNATHMSPLHTGPSGKTLAGWNSDDGAADPWRTTRHR